MAEQREYKEVYSVQAPAKIWGTTDARFIPADVRSSLNPGPQVQTKNEKNIIVQERR